MKLKLMVVDLELSKRAKRTVAAALVPVLVIVGGAVAYADMLHVWKDGDTLDASDLNGNFADHEARLAKLETPVSVLGVTSKAFVGSGLGTTLDGPTGGYAGAKQQCEAAFPQSSNAHMCVAAELVQFMARGGMMPTTDGAWYATGFHVDGTYSGTPMTTEVYDDCYGFVASGGGQVAPTYTSTPFKHFTFGDCTASYPILCCG